jgi:hypothetical protein
LPDGSANGQNRPVADLQGGSYERARSARKRSSAEGVGCAESRPSTRGFGLDQHWTFAKLCGRVRYGPLYYEILLNPPNHDALAGDPRTQSDGGDHAHRGGDRSKTKSVWAGVGNPCNPRDRPATAENGSGRRRRKRGLSKASPQPIREEFPDPVADAIKSFLHGLSST